MAYDDSSRDDYVDVAKRIADFREKHPDGSLQPADPAKPFEIRQIEGTGKDGKPYAATFIAYAAAAYRTPDDIRPGIGMAWEVFPGRTPYTLRSELQNAETSAWGRAIVAALASDSKRGIASSEEVRNRAAEQDGDDWRNQPAVQPRQLESTPDIAQWQKPAEPVTDMDWMREVVDDKIPAAKDQKTLNGYWADGLAKRDSGELTPEHWEEIKAFIRERAREIIPANGKPEAAEAEQPAEVAS